MVRLLKDLSEEYAAAKTRARIDQLIRVIIEFGSENRLQEEHLHQVRIRAKEARYTIEIAQQCFPELGYSDELVKKLRGLHQVLGKWHDDEIALEHLETFQGESSDQTPAIPSWEGSEESFPPLRGARGGSPYDELFKHLQKEKTNLLATFEESWDDFVKFLNEKPLYS